MDPRCARALSALARLPHTSVALVSGRALNWLREAVTCVPEPMMLFGSHGAEANDDEQASEGGNDKRAHRLSELAEALQRISWRFPGSMVETKPFGIALHYRHVVTMHAPTVVAQAMELAAHDPSVRVLHGAMVVELCTSRKTKADALERAKTLSGATRTAFLGDNPTDEDAFRALADHDLGVKVGTGFTNAKVRVEGVPEVADLLECIAEERKRWLAQSA
jgi:trehalose 6-phosphate phosphatase